MKSNLCQVKVPIGEDNKRIKEKQARNSKKKETGNLSEKAKKKKEFNTLMTETMELKSWVNMCLKEALLNSRLNKTKGLMLEKENLEQDRRD